MARIDPELIRRLKEETDLVRLIESYGTKLKDRPGTAGEMIGLCPIHDDKNPSLMVNRQKNEWCCLGACGKGGDVLEWVMHAEKTSFSHAVQLLQDGAVGALASRGTRPTHVRRLESPVKPDASDYELLAQVAEYYHQRLKQTPDALVYLQQRLITDPEAIEQFRIGFCDRTLGLRLPIKKRSDGAAIRERLARLGVMKDTGHELLRGCVTFPIPTPDGVGEIYGRRIDPKTKEDQCHWYLSGPHVGVWNEEALQVCDEIILCESVIDALTFWCAGYRNVTSIFGAKGLTTDILDALKRHEVQRLLLALDNDEAGNGAVDKHRDSFTRLGIELFRIQFPKDMDANEYALQAAAASGAVSVRDALGQLIRNAAWLGSGNAPAPRTETPSGDAPPAASQAAKEKNAAASVPPSGSETERAAPPSDLPGDTSEHSPAAALTAAPETSPAPGTAPVPNPLFSLAAEGRVDAAEAATAPTPHDPPTKELPVASPVPPAPPDVDVEIKENEIVLPIGNRSYRVRGLDKNLAFDVLKVNVLVRRDDTEKFYVDTFDLYAARARNVFIKEAAQELGFEPEVIKRDLGKVLLKLESLQDRQIQEALAVKEDKIEITDQDKQAALELLKSDRLIERILADFDACGVVGEETNKLFGYIAATSRKLDKPLAVMVQSSSAAGKSSLMDAVLGFMPPEEQITYSAMTGQSLFYMGGMDLKHKVLAISEEEGIRQAAYALKLLQSEGELNIASTGKDPGTGRMETQDYHVEGPVMIFLTTTSIDVDVELLNRCSVLTVNEDRDQTAAIHRQQRRDETLEGLRDARRRASIRKLHHDAQRLLRPLDVVNPYAERLRFLDNQTRFRRDHKKYLTLIRSVTLLHQYQRPLKTETIEGEVRQVIEVRASDIVLANRLADAVLGRSIDELPPQTRRLLWQLYEMVQQECQAQQLTPSAYRFLRRTVRERFGWGQTQLKLHLDRLVEMEYVLAHRGPGRTIEYELVWDGRGREGQPTLPGLIDPTECFPEESTAATTIEPSSGPQAASSGSPPASSGSSGPSSGPDRAKIGPSSALGEVGEPRKNPSKPPIDRKK